MQKSTISILVSIIILSPLAAFAQNIQTRIRNANPVIKNPSQADYRKQINHNDYRVPTTLKAE